MKKKVKKQHLFYMKKCDIGLMVKKVGKQGLGSHGYQSYITASTCVVCYNRQ